MLNIIFGIIIDTFSELRRRKVEKTEDIEGRCFICGIEKEIFDRALEGANGFEEHIKRRTGDHHMWHYFYFIAFVEEQDKDDDDGLEWHIRRCLAKRDISWFPMSTAMSLKKGSESLQDHKNGVRTHVQKMLFDCENKVTTMLKRFVEDATNHLDNFQKSISEPQKTAGESLMLWSDDEGEESEHSLVKEFEDDARDMDDDEMSDISSVGP
jgi:hypothetical protein